MLGLNRPTSILAHGPLPKLRRNDPHARVTPSHFAVLTSLKVRGRAPVSAKNNVPPAGLSDGVTTGARLNRERAPCKFNALPAGLV